MSKERISAMNIEIEYCVPCGYLDKAVDAQKTILNAFGEQLGQVALKPGNKGVYTFRVDGDVIYSKPDEYRIEDIVDTIKQRL
jgi:selenoprotein W-related protein